MHFSQKSVTAKLRSRFEFEKKTKRERRASTPSVDETTTMTEEHSARGAFLSPTSQSGFFSFFFPTRRLRLRRRRRRRLRLILLLLPSSRDREGYEAEVDGGRLVLALYGREKRFQSKKGRSAPHIPPVVSAGLGATEPLRGSTIRGPSGAQRVTTCDRGETRAVRMQARGF